MPALEPFMFTAGGREYALGAPAALLSNPPNLRDIAHHLAQINRFTGACSRPYSVAEHSLLVERIAAKRGASPIVRLAALMHDAHEAYTGDCASPAKQAIGGGWRQFEGFHATNVRHYFGLQTVFATHSAEIHRCDLIALATERRDLLTWDAAAHAPWPILDTPGHQVEPDDRLLPDDEPPLTWRGMRDALIERYLMLRRLVEERPVEVAA